MKKLPIIRHIRYFYYKIKFNYWWNNFGRYHWLAPNEMDLQYLDKIWSGKL